MKRALILALALALASCSAATPEPKIVIQKVEVPVPVPCVSSPPVAPDYPDTDALLATEPTMFGKLKRLLAGRVLRMAFSDQQNTVIESCSRLPSPK